LFTQLLKSFSEATDEKTQCVIDEFESFQAKTLAGDGVVGHGAMGCV
jgi:hypothetical protein